MSLVGPRPIVAAEVEKVWRSASGLLQGEARVDGALAGVRAKRAELRERVAAGLPVCGPLESF